jgi:SH3-like domain-containing protein
LNVGPGADGTPNNTVNSESVEASGTSTSQSVANVTPLPDLPSPAREYLSAVMPLPTWANVNENTITLNVRALPTVDSDILDFLPAGAPVEVVAFSEDGRWSQIERPRAGWVSNDFLLFQSQDASHTSIHLDVHPRRAQRYEVAVRAAPNANAKVIETLAPDEAVIVAARLDDANTWVQIADPAVGWVAVNDLVPHSP